jgi:ribosomal protein S18 acetylase RimI-like enzyme
MPHAAFAIVPVQAPSDLADVITLFTAYAGSLSIDLTYQGFAGEMAAMPGKYAPPKGELLLARGADGQPLGCVGLRPLDAPGCCEMKRLYVAPEGRGLGIGLALAEEIISAAKRIGYREMRLDTLPEMDKAIAIYRTLGFVPIAPYYDTPIAGTLFLAKQLEQSS